MDPYMRTITGDEPWRDQEKVISGKCDPSLLQRRLELKCIQLPPVMKKQKKRVQQVSILSVTYALRRMLLTGSDAFLKLVPL